MALEPITRKEKIIAGKDLEPVTRIEMFLKQYGGQDGADGKSAYEYAVDGGYTGTAEEFAAKLAMLANGPLTGTTDEITPKQVYDAVSAGIPVKVQYTDGAYGLLSFTAFNVAESLNAIVANSIVYYSGEFILCELAGNISTGDWISYSTILAQKT